jgi:hypothetical protein
MSNLRAAAAVGTVLLACGCGTTVASQGGVWTPPGAPVALGAAGLSDANSVSEAGGTWATVPMGGVGPNLFWQLVRLPASGGQWTLETPPNAATSGAVIVAGQQGQGAAAETLDVGIRPSIDLTFTPMVATSNGGRAWSSLAPESGLADVPDSLAAAPGGEMVALDKNQDVSELTSPGAANWSSLSSQRAVAATAAGRECGVTALTATAYTASSMPLLGAACGKAGVTGIFAYSAGTWHLAGPALTGPLAASLAGQRIQVLRLTRVGGTDAALLEAGSGPSAVLAAAWTADSGSHWTVSAVLKLGGAQPTSASFGANGATGVTLSNGRAALIDGPHGEWQPLPALPPGKSVTLALPAGQAPEALAANGGNLTISRLAPGAAKWTTAQVLKVPIQYGSSD